MKRVSQSVAAKVSRYKAGGFSIASAEGAGISRSKESLEEGRRLAEVGRDRIRRMKTEKAV